jgi:S-formylglutathione hydrolase FrmB
MFSACVAFSPGIYTDEEIINMNDDTWKRVFGVVYGPDLKGKDRISEQFKANDPFYIVKNSDINKIKSVRLYIDVGDDDFLYKGNSSFHILLRDMNIPHEYRVRDGGHHWSYWRSGLSDGLKFIGTSFHLP